MADELDDELQGMLDELDDDNDDLVESTISDQSEGSSQTETVNEPENTGDDNDDHADILDSLEEIDDSPAGAIRPVDERVVSADEVSNTDGFSTQDQELPVDIESYKEQLDVITNEVIDACRSDRQEAQEVIDDLRGRLNAIPNQAPKALVDGLVKAVEVKAGINQNAIKMMDTNAKFLASIRPMINVNNSSASINVEELNKILNSDQPMGD